MESTKRQDYASLERLLQQLGHDQAAMLDLLHISDTKQETLLAMLVALQQVRNRVTHAATIHSPPLQAVNRIGDNTERIFMQQAVRVIQTHSASGQDMNDLPSWLVTSWEVDIERRRIGSGGFGKVYPAKWHGTSIAIKELDSRTSSAVSFSAIRRANDTETCISQLLRQEINLWSKLLHPHVIRG
jgi:hypothetical protein